MKVRITYPIVAFHVEEIEVSKKDYTQIILQGTPAQQATFVQERLIGLVPTYDEPVGYVLLKESFVEGLSTFSVVEGKP